MANIAVVDDSAATVSMLTSILQSAGHTVVSYTDAAKADSELGEVKPDLVFMDIVMPEKNGYELIRGLSRNVNTKHIPIIVISTKGEKTDIAWGKRQGAVEYIVKPFNPEQILQAVQAHLAVA